MKKINELEIVFVYRGQIMINFQGQPIKLVMCASEGDLSPEERYHVKEGQLHMQRALNEFTDLCERKVTKGKKVQTIKIYPSRASLNEELLKKRESLRKKKVWFDYQDLRERQRTIKKYREEFPDDYLEIYPYK